MRWHAGISGWRRSLRDVHQGLCAMHQLSRDWLWLRGRRKERVLCWGCCCCGQVVRVCGQSLLGA